MWRSCRRGMTVALAIGITGCATIVHGGGKQRMTIDSDPTDATATIDGTTKLQTPASIKLKRNKDHTIVFEKPGYEIAQTLIHHEISGWVFGNILIGGLIGVAVDFGSGGAYKLDPDSTMMTLTPKPGAISLAPTTEAK